MPVYKVVLRDGDNPDTSTLHVVEKYCYADSRNAAQEIFTTTVGPKWHVAGPILVEESKVPNDAVFLNENPA